MNIGIVGSEGAKFSSIGEERARRIIDGLLMAGDTVVSGHCHLGGIDIYAEEAADRRGLQKLIFPPRELNWTNGYKPRNLLIARNSDIVYCITPNKLPPGYTGMRFKECYHCAKSGRNSTDHLKSGGCWTVLKAIEMGKRGEWITVDND